MRKYTVLLLLPDSLGDRQTYLAWVMAKEVKTAIVKGQMEAAYKFVERDGDGNDHHLEFEALAVFQGHKKDLKP